MSINQANIFKALADNTRLRIVNLFLSSGKSLCVCEVADALKLPQYRVSKHLNILRNAGLVCFEKRGTWAYHFLAKDNSQKKKLYQFLKTFLAGKVFDEDEKRLEQRLLLRKGGKCVVGFAEQEELTKLKNNKS